MELTHEQETTLVAALNAIEPGCAKIVTSYGYGVKAQIKHPRTGTSAEWYSSHATTLPTAKEIVAGMRAGLGIRAKRAARAIAAEREPT